METMPLAYAAKQELLDALLSPALLAVHVAGSQIENVLNIDLFFHPMEGIEGLKIAHLLAPPGHSALLVRGTYAAHSPRGSIYLPQAVCINVQEGAMLWWQDQWGDEPRRLEAGMSTFLLPNERHGFLVLEECLNYNVFTPAFGTPTHEQG